MSDPSIRSDVLVPAPFPVLSIVSATWIVTDLQTKHVGAQRERVGERFLEEEVELAPQDCKNL